MDDQLQHNKIQIIKPPPDEPATNQFHTWIERAIENLHQVLYTCGKQLWGETDQNQKVYTRSVCIKTHTEMSRLPSGTQTSD